MHRHGTTEAQPTRPQVHSPLAQSVVYAPPALPTVSADTNSTSLTSGFSFHVSGLSVSRSHFWSLYSVDSVDSYWARLRLQLQACRHFSSTGRFLSTPNCVCVWCVAARCTNRVPTNDDIPRPRRSLSVYESPLHSLAEAFSVTSAILASSRSPL